MSKCALPAKREGHQNGTILQTQKGSSVSRNGRKILSAFLLDTMSRHLPPPRCRRKKKKRRTYFGTGQKEISPKSRWDDTAGKSSRERQAPAPCMPQSECGAGHTGYRASPIRRRADHRTPAEPSAAEFSGLVSATAPSEQGVFAPCGFVLTSYK